MDRVVWAIDPATVQLAPSSYKPRQPRFVPSKDLQFSNALPSSVSLSETTRLHKLKCSVNWFQTWRHELVASLHDHLVDVDHGDELGAVVAELEELLDEAAIASSEDKNLLVLVLDTI